MNLFNDFGPIFTATYESDCESCEEGIVRGEDIRSDGAGGWIHADDPCERVAMNPRHTGTPRRESPCPECFTVHTGECL